MSTIQPTRSVICALVLTTLAAAQQRAPVDLITNGSFEAGEPATCVGTQLPDGWMLANVTPVDALTSNCASKKGLPLPTISLGTLSTAHRGVRCLGVPSGAAFSTKLSAPIANLQLYSLSGAFTASAAALGFDVYLANGPLLTATKTKVGTIGASAPVGSWFPHWLTFSGAVATAGHDHLIFDPITAGTYLGVDHLALFAVTGSVTDLGGGVPGISGIPLLEASGPMTPGTVQQLTASNSPPSSIALLALSFGPGPETLFGLEFVPAFDYLVGAVLDATGRGVVLLPIPNNTYFVGCPLFVQAAVLDYTVTPVPLSQTRALLCLIQ